MVLAGNFGLWRKGTMGSRALPMARELRAAGHEAVLVVPPWDAPEEADSAVRAWGVPVRNVAIGGGHAGRALAMLRAVLAERPDVVVAVKPKAYAGLLALLFAAVRPVRLVVDADDWEGRGGWNDLEGRSASARALIAWHEAACLRLADHVVVASRELERLATTVGVPAGRTTYLPNGTWPGAAGWPRGDGARARAALGLGGDPVVLLYSRLFEFDLAAFVEAFGRIVRAVPRARLLVVGAGLGGEEARLRAALGGAGLLERSALVGWAKREDVPDLLAAADVALVPMDDTLVNRCRCSVKLLDLMLAGRAVVAHAVGQATAYLRDGESGRLVAPGDTAAFADAAIALLKRPSTARRLGRAAERAARSAFAWAAQRESLVRAIVGAPPTFPPLEGRSDPRPSSPRARRNAARPCG